MGNGAFNVMLSRRDLNVQYDLPVISLVFSNASVRHQNKYEEHKQTLTFGVDFTNADYANCPKHRCFLLVQLTVSKTFVAVVAEAVKLNQKRVNLLLSMPASRNTVRFSRSRTRSKNFTQKKHQSPSRKNTKQKNSYHSLWKKEGF